MKLSLIVAMASLAIAAPSSSSSWSGQDGKQSKCLQISDRDAKVFTDKVNTAFAQQKNWKKVAQEIYTDDVYSTSRSYPYAQNKKGDNVGKDKAQFIQWIDALKPSHARTLDTTIQCNRIVHHGIIGFDEKNIEDTELYGKYDMKKDGKGRLVASRQDIDFGSSAGEEKSGYGGSHKDDGGYGDDHQNGQSGKSGGHGQKDNGDEHKSEDKNGQHPSGSGTKSPGGGNGDHDGKGQDNDNNQSTKANGSGSKSKHQRSDHGDGDDSPGRGPDIGSQSDSDKLKDGRGSKSSDGKYSGSGDHNDDHSSGRSNVQDGHGKDHKSKLTKRQGADTARKESQDGKDRCSLSISKQEAKAFTEANQKYFTQRSTWKKSAEKLYAQNVKVYSSSIETLLGKKNSKSAIYSSRSDFVKGASDGAITFRDTGSLKTYVDCEYIISTATLSTGKKGASNVAVTMISKMQKAKKGGHEASQLEIVLDTAAYGASTGGEYKPSKSGSRW